MCEGGGGAQVAREGLFEVGALEPRPEIWEAASHPRGSQEENIPGSRKSKCKCWKGSRAPDRRSTWSRAGARGVWWAGEGEARRAGHRSQVMGPGRPDHGAVDFIWCLCSDDKSHCYESYVSTRFPWKRGLQTNGGRRLVSSCLQAKDSFSIFNGSYTSARIALQCLDFASWLAKPKIFAMQFFAEECSCSFA